MFVNWNDVLELASKLTVKRIINALRITISYIYARYTKKAIVLGLPISISVEPTTACNLKCPECPSGLRSFSRPTGKITLALFEKIVRDVSDYTSYLTFYFQGEPYLHPQFLDMVKIASERNMYTATSTNAHFLHEKACMETIKSGLSRLIISIDGTTQETYSSYRKEGSLEKVIAGTKEIIHWKKKMNSSTPAIVWQFLVVRPNQHQIQEVQQLAKEIGVEKVALKTAQVYDYAEGNDLIPTIDKYARYKKMVDGTYSIKNKLLDQCWKMWSSCVITWDGKIVPCCFDKDAHHVVGDLNQQSFAQSWKSEPYQQFRQTLLQGRDQIEMCKNCSEGTKIWA